MVGLMSLVCWMAFICRLKVWGRLLTSTVPTSVFFVAGYGPSSGCCPVSLPTHTRGLHLKVIVILGELSSSVIIFLPVKSTVTDADFVYIVLRPAPFKKQSWLPIT